MTKQEFDEIVKVTCPHCATGLDVRQRTDTKEWVHNFAAKVAQTPNPAVRVGHTLCLATHLRNSKFAEVTGG